MSIDLQNQETVESVKQPLELLKVLGGKLKTNNLRMNTIKDRLEMSRIQVENVKEQKQEQASQEVEESKGVAYEAVADDAIDQLVKKLLSSKPIEVSIYRVHEGVYQIADKTLPIQINSDNDQILEVRVGSTWIKLEDYLNNLKHREEKVRMSANLDDIEETKGSGQGQAKGKKKKKKAKKKKMELDLDMDDDDPTRQTRFSGHLSPKDCQNLSDTNRKSETRLSEPGPKGRKSVNKKKGLDVIESGDESAGSDS